MKSSKGEVHEWSDETYFADRDYISSSMLKVFREDLEGYVAEFVRGEVKGKKSSRSMALGTAVHQWWLEGKRPVGAATHPGCPEKLIAARAWAKEAGVEGLLLNGKESVAAAGMLNSLEASEYATAARESAEILEHVVTWVQETDGPLPIMCKAKIDIAGRTPEGQWILDDLKTTRHASLGAFRNSAAEYGYAYQAAFYREALRSLGAEVDSCSCIAVSSKSPYNVFVLEFSEDELDFAYRTNQLGLTELSIAMYKGWKNA